jgi:hypothetical protein
LTIRPQFALVLAVLSSAWMPREASALEPTPASAPPPAQSAPPPSAPVPPPAGAATTVPQSAPAASPVPAPTPDEMRHRRVSVDIDGTKPSAVVERRVSFTETEGAYFFVPFRASSAIWEQVCVTPCQVDLDRFSTYRVAARNHVSASRGFTLPQSPDALQLKVDAGDLMGHRVGLAMGGAGVAAIIVGAALVAGEGVFDNETKARDAGYITGGAGILVLAIGIPIALLTTTTVSAGDTKLALTPRGFRF